jgi:hypothetical protein
LLHNPDLDLGHFVKNFDYLLCLSPTAWYSSFYPKANE